MYARADTYTRTTCAHARTHAQTQTHTHTRTRTQVKTHIYVKEPHNRYVKEPPEYPTTVCIFIAQM